MSQLPTPAPAADRRSRVASALSVLVVALAALAAALGSGRARAASQPATAALGVHVNVTTGGLLRAGVYGRIEARRGEPPPVIFPQPVVAQPQQGVQQLPRPIYLYVPAGQVRRWPQHCHKWQACTVPVFFVRMDDSPSRLGRWKAAREAERPRLLPVPGPAEL